MINEPVKGDQEAEAGCRPQLVVVNSFASSRLHHTSVECPPPFDNIHHNLEFTLQNEIRYRFLEVERFKYIAYTGVYFYQRAEKTG